MTTRKVPKYGGGATSEPDSPEPEARDDRTEEGEAAPKGERVPPPFTKRKEGQAMHRLQRFLPIFYGHPSRALWRRLRRVRAGKTHDAIFELALGCQRLEDHIIALEQRLATLEREVV